jgi:hypothetical protein
MKSKRLFLLSLILNLVINSYSQVTSITTIEDGFIIDFTLPAYSVKDTNIFEVYGINQIYSFIEMEQLGQMMDIGYPNLPQHTIDLHIPDDASQFCVNISNRITETKYLFNKIIPAQDLDEENDIVFSIENSYYTSSGSLYDFDYQISDTFNIMGANGLSFSIFPYQYNPNLNKIEVIKSCRFTLKHNGSSSIQLKSSTVNNTIKDHYLHSVFENYPILKSGSIDRGRYLIITALDYEDALLYFANYKRNIGYNVTVVNTNTTGTTASDIKNYIQAQYNNSSTRPSFVLLVGDHADIPASSGSTSSNYNDDDLKNDYKDPLTDLNYALLSGDDYFADIFLGRFSVSSIPQLQNIIFKTIFMETNLHNLNRNAILLAGGGSGENQFDNPQRWVMDNVLNNQDFDYDFYFAVDGATRMDGLNALDGDYTIFLYRGHGGYDQLGSPFNLDEWDINNSSNTIFPFGFGFACLTNCFAYAHDECFGEAWLRSEHGGISYFGATTITYRHTNNVIEERVIDKMDDKDQLSPFINIGMKEYYKRFWSWLSVNRRKLHIKSYNLLGDPSIYLYGIGCQDDFIFTNNETFHSGDRITYNASNDIIVAEGYATFNIEDGSEVKLIAGNSVTLKPGFNAEIGSEFSASIAHCNSSSLKKAKICNDVNSELDQTIAKETNIDSALTQHNIFTCFPNPANENITFYFKINAKEATYISIIDILGNVVIKKTLDNNPANEWSKVNLNISSLPVGTYFYLINYSNSYEKGKFIKVK